MTICGRECMAYGRFANIPERPLGKNEFDEITRTLETFYGIAKSETDPGEHFLLLQPAEREKLLEASEQEHGIRYGGFGGNYMYVQFDTDKPDVIMMNAFEDPKSVQSYVDWMRVWWKSCWASLDP